MQKALILLFIFFMAICCIFFALSHAPSKRNKTKKRATMRKWSTIFIIVTFGIGLLFVSQPIVACSTALSFALLDMAFTRIIAHL